MITVAEAKNQIASYLREFPVEDCALTEAYGRILRSSITSERDQPPFHRVAMDGIAFRFESWQQGKREFPIRGIQAAGMAPQKLNDENDCLEVMTGAVLPIGCDCVVKVEDLSIENGLAKLLPNLELKFMQHVHQRGSDHLAGANLLEPGIRIHSPQMGVLAANGVEQVQVTRNPRIAIVTTGDELVDFGKQPEPHEIRRSNAYSLLGAFQSEGWSDCALFHLPDDQEKLFHSLQEIIANKDVVVLSGGVSMGKFDFVPKVLSDLQVECHFHKVSQRPGKPLWFGTTASGTAVFGLPGNPVSALVCAHHYVLPGLRRVSMEAEVQATKVSAKLLEEVQFSPALTYFLPVRLTWSGAELQATPVYGNGSGDYATPAHSDGFIELTAQTEKFPVGWEAPVTLWGHA